MQKIEELTLYVIEADKRSARDEALIARQQDLLTQLETKLQALQQEVDRARR